MAWENTSVKFSLVFDFVMQKLGLHASITLPPVQVVVLFTRRRPLNYFDNGKDQQQALDWATIATKLTRIVLACG